MQVYSIHLRPDARSPDRDAVVIREGFCWPAFLFGPFWALWHGLWPALIGILVALAALAGAGALLRPDPATEIALSLAFSLIVGFSGNDWRRAALARRGWRFEGLAAAPDRDTAMRRFFDLHPDAAGGGPAGSAA